MKISAIICEFNPFHNGHEYLINEAKKITGCDAVICIMSGCFTQRGDIAVTDKHLRARHAVLGGADLVIELPAAFATATAEIFSAGAIKILNSIKQVDYLVFGCENAEADFLAEAGKLLNESRSFKEDLSLLLKSGKSYISSYVETYEKHGGVKNFLTQPNNILGIEYCKALLNFNSHIKPVPIKRIGADYKDGALYKNYSSSSAIRDSILSEDVKYNVPDYVLADLKDFSAETQTFQKLAAYAVAAAGKTELKKLFGCGEGLENKLQENAYLGYESLVKSAAGKRYSEARIKRILLTCLLKLSQDESKNFLAGDLYIRPVAIKKSEADSLLPVIAAADFHAVIKPKDVNLLSKTAKKCLEKDLYAQKIWNFICGLPFDGFDHMTIV